MKKFLTIFFVTLGAIFFLLLLAGTYFFVTDPLNLKPLLFGSPAPACQPAPSATGSETNSATSETSAPEAAPTDSALSPSQQAALESVGIDAASLPSEISPEQEACFTAILGAERVAEIKAGDTPTMTEFFAARSCIE